VRRTLRRLGFSFRRARRTLPKEPARDAEARVEKALTKLHALELGGKCDVLYTDASGFCLQPCVPYLWQKKAVKGQKAVGLVSQAHSRRLSVLGFFRSRDSTLWSFPTTERLTAQHVVESVEALLPQLVRPAVLVLDNASVHRAKAVREKRAKWKKQGLRLLFLPPYCPHLNRIELLWKQIKYRWLAPSDYLDFPTLSQSVTDILEQVGTKYRVSFE
jgi:hypothetical protein